MEGLAILALLALLFFLIVVPVVAFSASARAGRAEAALAKLEQRIAQLSSDLSEARLALAEVSQHREATVAPPQMASSDPATTSAARKRSRRGEIIQASAVPDSTTTLSANKDVIAPPVPTDEPERTNSHPGTAESVQEMEHEKEPATAPVSGAESAEGAAPPQRSLEEVVGTRWTVWVGALALGLGGLFLVRYSIEAGFFGPRVRLLLAALFSLLLVAAGEVLRRGLFSAQRITALPSEHAPLALTAAGCVVGFGTIYAAYAVYGFISPVAAFLLLALVGGGTMAAALLHGQPLAAVGLLGAYATPILVGGEAKSLWPLVIYIVSIGIAALAMNRRFQAAWMHVAVAIAVVLWALLLSMSRVEGDAGPLLFLVLASLVSFLAALSWLRLPTKPETPFGDWVLMACLIPIAMVLGLAFLRLDLPVGPAVAGGLAAIALLGVSAARDPRMLFAMPLSLVLSLGVILTWPGIEGSSGPVARVIAGVRLATPSAPLSSNLLLMFGGASVAMLLVAGLLRPLGLIEPVWPHGRRGRLMASFAAGLGGPLALMALTIRRGLWQQDLGAAALFLAASAVCAALAVMLLRNVRDQADPPSDAVGYVAGAALAFGLAIAFALPGLWMAVGFSVAGAAIAWLNGINPMPGLRRVAGAFASAAVIRAVLAPELLGSSHWLILNSYIFAYAAPSAALAAGSLWLRRRAVDRTAQTFDLGAVLFALAFVLLQLRHAFHGDNLLARPAFHEAWLAVIAGAGFVALGLWLKRLQGGLSGAVSLHAGLLISAVAVVLGLLLIRNPFIDGLPVHGWVIFNRLFAGYLLALLACGLIAMLLRETWRDASMFMVICAVVLVVLLVVSQIRMLFHGADLIDDWRIGLGEAGCYALCLIALTAAALIAGNEAAGLRHRTEVASNGGAFAATFLLCLVVANPFESIVLTTFGPFDGSYVGYLCVGIGFGALAYLGRVNPTPHRAGLTTANRWVAILLGYLFLLVQLRRAFVGAADIGDAPFSEAEHYALSLGTLLYGVLLLAIGLKFVSREVRLGSAAFVMLAVLKIFLYDMAGLSGLWRPVSFIGLGAVLIGIGVAYQRLLFRPEPQPLVGSS